MIAVAQNHCCQVFAEARVDGEMIVERILLGIPAVERFIDHHHAQAVARIEHGACLRIMGSTNEIEPSLLHQAHLAYLGSIECHCAQNAIVVVHACSIDERRLSVEQESSRGIVAEGAHTMLHGQFTHLDVVEFRIGR